MASTRPRLRRDLIIRRMDLREGPSFVVKDPASEQFYRFREAEHFLLTRLDGRHTAADLQRLAAERFGAELPAETLDEFLKTLARHKLLDTGTLPEPRRSNGGILGIRFKTFDPDRLLGALEPRLRWLFRRPFVIGTLMAASMALVITVMGAPQMLAELLRFHWTHLVLLAWATFLAVGMVHELAHGLACRHFGGRVREMGFMLLYFQPALYCNVSDAWLFTDKSKRMWVMLAGAFSELVLWAAATFTWAVTDGDTPLHRIALIVLAATGIKTFFNFNPLLKLDGYYLLSDWLEVPNLRGRSFRWIGAHLGAWFGGGEPVVEEASPRERRIFVWYGWLAIAFSFVFLAFVAQRIGGYLLGTWQAWGVVPFVLVLWLAFRRRFRRLAPSAAATRPAARRRRRPWRAALAAAALAAALVYAYQLPTDLKVTGEFLVVPLENAEVRSEVDGLVAEVLVTEGQRVKAGDPIARLDDRELRTQLIKLQSAQEQQSVVAHYAGSNLTRFRALRDAEVVSQREYETAEQQLAVAEAEIERLDADRRLIEDQLQRVYINSPIDGVITTPARDLREMRGRFVRRGDRVATIHELSTVMAEIAIPEKEIADVTRGQEVVLKARAFPGRLFTGRVNTVATRVQKGVEPELQGGVNTMGMAPAAAPGQQVLVTTLLDNPDAMLKPDMTGKAKILCGRRSLGELFLRRLARTVRVELWSWW